ARHRPGRRSQQLLRWRVRALLMQGYAREPTRRVPPRWASCRGVSAWARLHATGVLHVLSAVLAVMRATGTGPAARDHTRAAHAGIGRGSRRHARGAYGSVQPRPVLFAA